MTSINQSNELQVETHEFNETLGSKLQLQCADGKMLHVTHEEAMMSSTLWTLLQDLTNKKPSKRKFKRHTIPIYDVPSSSVVLALGYCRCLYKKLVEGQEQSLLEWEERFYDLDSKTLCDLAKVASHLDIQELVDLTCRSIADIMSATEAAHEIQAKFGLAKPSASISSSFVHHIHDAQHSCSMIQSSDYENNETCHCDLRHGLSGLDFDMLTSLEHDLSTDEYELVELDQPSVDELVDFINGDINSNTRKGENMKTGNKKKKKKKKKNKTNVKGNEIEKESITDEDKQVQKIINVKDSLSAKMELAWKNPSAVFQESQFEDDEDDDTIESFRLALESAHLDSKRRKHVKPRVKVKLKLDNKLTPFNKTNTTNDNAQQETGDI